MTALVLLPGMDGIGDLFAPLLEVLERTAQVVRYPSSSSFGYAELTAFARDALPSDTPFASCSNCNASRFLCCISGHPRDRLVPAAASEIVATNGQDVRVAELVAPHFLLQTRPREAAREISRLIAELESCP